MIATQGGSGTLGLALRGLADAPGGGGFALLDALGRGRSPATEAAFERIGGDLEILASAEGGLLHVTVLPEDAEAAIEALATIVRGDLASPTTVESIALLARGDQAWTSRSPAVVAEEGLRRVVFGTGAFCERDAPTRAEIDAWTPETLTSAGQRLLRPERAALIVSGAIDPARAAAAAERAFGEWSTPPDVAPPSAPPPAIRPTAIRVIPRRGLAQATILLGQVGAPASSSVALGQELQAHFIGNVLHSRLRDELGLTYGVDARLRSGHACPLVTIQTAVDEARVGEALALVVDTLRGLRRAKFHSSGYLRRRRLAAMASYADDGDAVTRLARRYWHHQGFDERAEHPLAQAELRPITKVADALADRYAYQIVIVGDPEAIQRQLADRGIGPVELLEVDPPS
ncbi:MAG: insulinase family protein [Myxococcales bacterium]|nr:insulinase family protein [Myxococcales bacterium]